MSFLFGGKVPYMCRVYPQKGRTSEVQVHVTESRVVICLHVCIDFLFALFIEHVTILHDEKQLQIQKHDFRQNRGPRALERQRQLRSQNPPKTHNYQTLKGCKFTVQGLV